jgi:hypothetical protein
MRRGLVFAAACLWAACGVSNSAGQIAGPGAVNDAASTRRDLHGIAKSCPTPANPPT